MPLFSFNPTMTTKKAIIIGTLCAIGVSLTAYAVKKGIDFKPKTITESYADDVETANGTWYFNNEITDVPISSGATATSFAINFTYANNETEQNQIFMAKTSNVISLRYRRQTNTYTNVYTSANGWINQNYKTIKITGGTNTTNETLIQWLKQNATKLQNTIENTAWKINHEITAESAYGNFFVNFYSNGFKYNILRIGYYAISANTPTATQNAFMFNNSYNIYNDGTWEHERQWSRLTITDGTDVTNIALITWLYQNAKQMEFISNPINTKWVFENVINTTSISDDIYNIQFTTNRKQSFFMQVGRATNTIDYALKTNDSTPYTLNNVYNTYWLSPNYQTIIITGTETIMNSGVNDPFLIISFLQSNANGTSYTPIPTNPDSFDIEDGNFVSIQSLMLKILTMPFTFIIQAFDVTLWPNTAWEFNIGNFILAIIAICAVLFIIKVFTSGFSVIGNYTNNRNQNKLTKSQIETNKTRAELNKARTEKVRKDTK